MANPSENTIKRLFAASGNRCAFPGCDRPLVARDTVVGEVCYIQAERAGGPRYDAAQSEGERHSFGNLLLMCPTHHEMIDGDPDAYTAEELLRIKASNDAAHADGKEPSDAIVKQMLVRIDTGGGAYVEGSVDTGRGLC